MDVLIINPFIVATRAVFDRMVKLPFKIGKPYLKRADDRLYKLYKVAATIGFSGGGTGICVLNLSEPTAFALAGGLTGTTPDKLNADCLDAIGEIANMIAGGAKKDLPGGQIRMSTPKILRTHQVIYPPGLPVIAIPADTGAGRFVIEVAFRANEPVVEPALGPN